LTLADISGSVLERLISSHRHSNTWNVIVGPSRQSRLRRLGSYLLGVAPLVATALGPAPAGDLEAWANAQAVIHKKERMRSEAAGHEPRSVDLN
jgi:hypothetical protein